MTGSATHPGLDVSGLSHAFGTRRVVDEVAFTIPRGEVHCLVGPSGCGKTTTLRLIAGLEVVQSGRIAIAGRVVANERHGLPPERRHVGLMFQDFALFPHLTVGENVGFGLSGLRRRERAERVARLLARVDLAGYAAAYPHTLSGGEQQRVALARALAPEPALMLLDEAFSALDTTLRAQVREETLGILKETGTPTLLVTHDAEEAVQVGDCIHAMQAGRIVQSGPPATLYADPHNALVAGFFGPVNRFAGVVEAGMVATPLGQVPAKGLPEGAMVDAIVRPEAIRTRVAGGSDAARGTIRSRRDLGPVSVLTLELLDGSAVSVRQAPAVERTVGEVVELEIEPRQFFLFVRDHKPSDCTSV